MSPMILSIITINYNNLEGLKKTIASVMAQTWRDFEWIIIDGGSTDGSKEYIEQIAADPANNISYWCSELDGGVYFAMNKGIAKAQGEYLNFMNSGDSFYSPTIIEDFSRHPVGKDIYYGDWMKVYSDHEEFKTYPTPFEYYSLFRRNICHQAMFINSALLKNKGFDESYKVLADYKRWIQAALDGCSFEHLGFAVCNYDMSGMSSTDDTTKEQEGIRISEIVPISIKRSMNRLDYYEKNYCIQVVSNAIEKRGLIRLVLLLFVRCLNALFVHYDINKSDYNY